MPPYRDDGLNKIYELLFCDDAALYRDGHAAADDHPWSVLLALRPDPEALRGVIEDPKVETRPKILAANLLRAAGEPLPPKQLFGVVVEVAMDEGLDVIAAYEDGSARYINYSGRLIVWDAATAESKHLIDQLLRASQVVVDQIGPWGRGRLNPPKAGNVRMSFLVSDGLYFGEGPFNDIAGDPMGGPVINSAAGLMNFLIEHATAQSR